MLLLHDGELADVRAVLRNLGAACWEKLDSDAPERWDLAIGTPRHLPAIASLRGVPRSHRMAIVDHDSRTLRSLVRRSGIRIVVRRPVHPTALRLLLLHSLYRGRERRRPRVAVGAPVRFRLGLKSHEATLADLSLEGCRLLTKAPLTSGNQILLSPPRSSGKGWLLWGRVIRIQREPDYDGASVAVQFRWLTRGAKKRLAELLRVYETGPASLDRAGRDAKANALAKGAAKGATLAAASESRSTSEAVAAPAGAQPERRRAPRIDFTGRVVAHDREASRVLIGRDLSLGGMRVEAHPALGVGKSLRLALHIPQGGKSIAVKARVIRSDDSKGVALRFADLAKEDEEVLRRLIHGLPSLELNEDDGEEEIVLTEIVEVEGDQPEAVV